MKLEVISRLPAAGSPRPTPLLFVHGAFTGAWIWDEHFLPDFARRGFAAHALSLRGHGRSEGRYHLPGASLDDYVNDVTRTVATLGPQTVLVGHSMGGAVVQRYLRSATATAAVLMASLPPHGLLAAGAGMFVRAPGFADDLSRLHAGGRPSLETVRRALFAEEIPEARLRAYAQRMQPESHRVVLDLMAPHLHSPLMPRRGYGAAVPVLVVGARQDAFLSPFLVEATARAWGTRARIFPRMGHAMMLERRWRRVADYVASWIVRVTRNAG